MSERPLKVGARVRVMRQQRDLSLRALAERCELSPNTISLIERGESSPSVSTLHRLATALDVHITDFFESQKEKSKAILTRVNKRPCSENDSVLLESLGSGLQNQTLEPFLVTLCPGAGSGDQEMAHAGHEFVYCLQGMIEYEVAGQIYQLVAGDALLIEAQSPHRWRNLGDGAAVFLLVFQTAVRNDAVAQHLLS